MNSNTKTLVKPHFTGNLHAKLSCSGSHRWVSCAGSVKAEERYPNTNSSFAIEGTHAHELAELLLNDQTPSDSLYDPLMIDYVKEYTDYVNSYATNHPTTQLLVEKQLDLTHIIPDGFGTADAVVVDHHNDHLHVFDLKYGQGVKVDAYRNSQLLLYAIGAHNLFPKHTITTHIVQPRLKSKTTYTLNHTDLVNYAQHFKNRAHEALKDDAPRIASEDACKWCRARATCPEANKYVTDVVSQSFDVLSPDVIRYILDNEKLILDQIKAVKSYALTNVPDGYKRVHSRTNKRWRNDDEVMHILKKVAPEAIQTTIKPITPTQALNLKLLDLIPELEDLIYRPEGKITLAPMDDPREEIDNSFEDLTRN